MVHRNAVRESGRAQVEINDENELSLEWTTWHYPELCYTRNKQAAGADSVGKIINGNVVKPQVGGAAQAAEVGEELLAYCGIPR